MLSLDVVMFMIAVIILSTFYYRCIREISWMRWMFFLCLAIGIDIASTYYAVYVHHAPWSEELNPATHWLALTMGYDVALIVHGILAIAITCVCGFALKRTKMLFIFSQGMCVAACLHLFAAVNNVFQFDYSRIITIVTKI